MKQRICRRRENLKYCMQKKENSRSYTEGAA